MLVLLKGCAGEQIYVIETIFLHFSHEYVIFTYHRLHRLWSKNWLPGSIQYQRSSILVWRGKKQHWWVLPLSWLVSSFFRRRRKKTLVDIFLSHEFFWRIKTQLWRISSSLMIIQFFFWRKNNNICRYLPLSWLVNSFGE